MELLIIMALAVGAMFLLSSRTRKQHKEASAFRSQLAEGDEVMTASGLFGTVIAIDGDVITLESPSGGRTDWLRGAIAKLASPPYAEDDRAAEDEDGEYDAEAYEEEYADDQPGDESYEVGAPDRAAPDGRDRVGDAGPDAPGTSRPGAGGSAVTGTDAPSQGEAERRA